MDPLAMGLLSGEIIGGQHLEVTVDAQGRGLTFGGPDGSQKSGGGAPAGDDGLSPAPKLIK
jgi:hypothetical protein